MTKAEIIARHGAEYYKAQQIRNKEAAKRRYWEYPDSRKTAAQSTAGAKRWLAKPGNLEKERARKLKLANAKWAAMSPEERNAKSAAAWQRKQARLKTDEATYLAYRETARARHLAWREANRDHVNASHKKLLEDPAVQEYYRTYAVANRAKRRTGGTMNRTYVQWIRTQVCIDCGSNEKIEVGHIVPVCEGGDNHNSNLIPQCRPCNRRLSGKRHRLALTS